MSIGFDKPLYVLPFDHRGSFQEGLFGWKGHLSPEQTAEVAAAKAVVYDGFKRAQAAGVAKEKAGILVDEQFGAAILKDAVAHGYSVSCPAEKSGQKEFDFEYGADFAKHIEAVNPTFCKVLVRYNPEGDKKANEVQSARLKKLSDYLHSHNRMFMFELLVPAEPAQLAKVANDKKRYDVELRPGLMVQAIHQLQDAGIEADVWKIEGLDRRDDCVKVVAAARRGGRNKVGCIVLGRGEDDKKVREWLSVAAPVPGFIGFAVGRTTFWEPLVAWKADRNVRDKSVAEIARRYREWVDIFERARRAVWIAATRSRAAAQSERVPDLPTRNSAAGAAQAPAIAANKSRGLFAQAAVRSGVPGKDRVRGNSWPLAARSRQEDHSSSNGSTRARFRS